jgi:CHAT domain-containing protein
MEKDLEDLCLEVGRAEPEDQAAILALNEEVLVNEGIVTQLSEEVRTYCRVNVPRAQVLAEAALAIARRLSNPTQLGVALRARGNVDWIKGECKFAVTRFREAETLFGNAGNNNELARTLSSSIQPLLLLGDYDDAHSAAAKAKSIFEKLGENWRLARVDINVANIFHRQNRYAEALEAYRTAYRKLLPHNDIEGLGVALHNVVVCLIALDNFHGALDAYERAREFCATNEMPLLASQADYNLAYLYYLRGDYTKALALLRITRDLCRKNEDNYHLGLCDLDQSEIYLELGLVDEAAEMAQNCLSHFQQEGMGFELARSYTNLAIARNMSGNHAEALELFAQAKRIAQEENNAVWPNIIDLYSALVLLEDDQLASARDLSLSAAAFFGAQKMPSKQILSLLVLTRVELKAGDLDHASRSCAAAMQVLGSLDAPILNYQARFLEGQILEAKGKPEEAYRSYQNSRSALETLRSSIQRQELKIGLMQNRWEVYTRLVRICLDRGSDLRHKEEALSYVEAAKSRTLRDLILDSNQTADQVAGETNADRHLRNLRQDLNWYYRRLEREQLSLDRISPDHLNLLKDEVKAREQEFLRLLLEAPDEATVGLALANSKTASLDEIRAALQPSAALLEYFPIDNRMYAAVITSKNLEIVELGELDVLAYRLRMLQFQFSKFRLDRRYASRFEDALVKATQDHLHVLYENFFAPLGGLQGIEDLAVIPSGRLHAVPFQALFDGQNYLAERFNISYAPSASIFAHIQQKSKAVPGPSLILGVTDDNIPFVREEVAAVAAAIPQSHTFTGEDATEQILRELGPKAHMIHIASHGVFRHDSPLFSSIKLANSYLTLYDLYHMKLPADLLTLSGCVTGLNHVADGDELVGLTRGLLSAGAKSLLLSLWDVDDRCTSELMGQFYENLASGQKKSVALRLAMKKIRDRHPHPYYWASFKLIGQSLS